MLCVLLLSLHMTHAQTVKKRVDLRPPHEQREVLQMAKPQYTKNSKKEDPKLDVSIKSSIPEKIVDQQVGKIDPKPYTSDAALPNVGDVLKNSTNGVDVKVRF